MKLNLPVDVFVKQCTKISVLFERSLKALQDKTTVETYQEGEKVDDFYLKLYRDMIAIQYGYRQSPIQTEVAEKDITAMDWKLYNLQKEVEKQIKSDTFYNELQFVQQFPDIPWNNITPKMANHIVKMAKVFLEEAAAAGQLED
jgi:hypothetical protein